MNFRKIRKAIEDAGGSLEVRKGGSHVIIRDKNGKQIAVMSSSPSDHRSGLNFIAQLRRAGINIPRK